MTSTPCCGECRSIHICRERCGLAPEGRRNSTPPAAPRQRRALWLVDVAAVLILLSLPALSLLLARGA